MDLTTNDLTINDLTTNDLTTNDLMTGLHGMMPLDETLLGR